MALSLTLEQKAIVAGAKAGESFKVAALAGTGKTKTMEFVTEALPSRRVLYVAYNASTAAEARTRFGRNVTVKTGHALAFRYAGYVYKSRLARNPWEIKRAVEEFLKADLVYRRDGRWVNDYDGLYGVLETLQTFLQSAEDELGDAHVPEHVPLPKRDRLRRLAERTWVWMRSERSDAPVSHDLYLKVFQLRHQRVPDVDVIIVDEMQDSNPVFLDIVKRQEPAQTIGIGDANQAIYGWRGAIDALERLALPELTLTTSWRFGGQIAEVANAVLEAKGCALRLTGGGPAGAVVERISTPTAVVTRTNAGLVTEALHLVSQPEQDAPMRSIGFVGGVKRAIAPIRGAYDLYRLGYSKHEEFRVFEGWHELVEAVESKQGGSLGPYVRVVEKYRHGIPEICEDLERRAVPPEEADVVFSTAHSFKGNESARVRVGSDFSAFMAVNDDNGAIELRLEEANLSYVTLTRAQVELDIGGYVATLRESLRLAAQMRKQRAVVEAAS